MDIFQFLAEHRIQYERVEHPPVFTCKEAAQLVPPMPGVRTKNLFCARQERPSPYPRRSGS